MRIFLILSFFLLSLSGVCGQISGHRLIITQLTGDFYIYTTYGFYKGSPVPANSRYLDRWPNMEK